MADTGAQLAVIVFAEAFKWGVRVPLGMALWIGDVVAWATLGLVELTRGKESRIRVKEEMDRGLGRRMTRELAGN